MALMDRALSHDGRDHIGPIVAENGGIRVMACSECGYHHIWPLPTMDEVSAYYADDRLYNEHAPPDFWDAERAEEPYWRLVYADYLDSLAIYTDKPLDEPLSLLDVGCGSGIFLDTARVKGWQGLGIEPSPQARALARQRGVKVVHRMEEVTQRFDAAALLLVLEHVLDPLGMLELVSARLVSKGIILAVAPNDGNPLQDVARKVHGLPPYWICRPHLSYFQPESLKRLMEKAGLKVVETRCSYPLETTLLQGTQYVGNEERGRAMYREKMAYETALYQHGQRELLRQMQRAWANLNIGREVVMVGVKQ